jgi:hypothetical protein
MIHFDNRMQFGQPFFILIDRLWDAINLRIRRILRFHLDPFSLDGSALLLDNPKK